MQKNEQKKEKIFRIIILLLVIIIIILLFFSKFGRINNYPIPTGNVNVFDIDIRCNHPNENIADTSYIDEDGNAIAVLPSFDKEKDSKKFGPVFVDDKNGNYIYQQNLEIFNNAAFDYTNKIAPGVQNTYHFVVHNSSNLNLKYYIEMYEESEYQVNLRYRLKRNENFVIGNDSTWVTVDELKTKLEYISLGSSDSYSLDWKWFDNENNTDTIAGENMRSLYKLNIRFHFEAVEV